MHISDCRQFSDIHITQGSVATYLCGGIFKYEFVANLPLKDFWKSVNIRGTYGQEFSVLFFLTHGVRVVQLKHVPVEIVFNHISILASIHLGLGVGITTITVHSIPIEVTLEFKSFKYDISMYHFNCTYYHLFNVLSNNFIKIYIVQPSSRYENLKTISSWASKKSFSLYTCGGQSSDHCLKWNF